MLEKLSELNQIVRVINSATDLNEVLKLIIQQGIRLLDVSYGDIWLVEKQTGDLRLLYSTKENKIPKKKRAIPRGKGVLGWVVQNKKKAIISDVEWDKRYIALFPGMKSELAFPLFFQDVVIGVMNFESENKNAFSSYEEELLNALAEHAIIAIRNAKLLERENCFWEIDRAILDSHLDLEATLSVLIEEGLKLLETKKGQILLFDGKETLELVASVPIKDIGLKFNVHDCVFGKAVKEKKTIYVQDVSKEPLYKRILGEEIVAEMAAPLISNGEVLGVFNIENSYRFSDDDKALLQTLAGQAAIAIKNAQLVEEQRFQNKLLAAFRKIDEVIVDPAIDIQSALATILKNGLSLLGADKGQLLLRENNKLIIHVTIGNISNSSIESITLDEGVCGYAAKVKKPQIVPDVSKDKRFISTIGGTRSELAYPLMDNEKVIGVFNAESPVKDFFNEGHLKILDAAKMQIITAIRNAELQELIKRVSEIISDINAARSLDETLVKILNSALQLIKVPNGQLLEVDKNKNELEIKVTCGEYDTKKADRFPIGEIGVQSWAVKNKKAIRIADVTKEPRYLGYLKNMKSELAVPLITDGRVIGVINIESPELDFFTEQHEKILGLLANGASLAMKNAKSREKMKQMTILKNMGQYNERLLHWIGNKAAPVLGCANRLLEDINTAIFEPEIKESVIEDLEIIRDNSTLMLDVKKEFIGVTRDLEMKPINLADILEESIKRKNIRGEILDLNIEKRIPRVKGDKKGLDMVISNLLENALDAMEGIKEKKLQVILKQDPEGKHLLLKVADNGCGISRDDLSKVFLPFFTKKSKGTGIGLAISREIVAAMEGEISVESEEQKGTSFIVKLPIEGD